MREMGYLDSLAAGQFKTDDCGQEIYFPLGALGRGRIVPSETEAIWLRHKLRLFHIFSLVGILPLLLAMGGVFDEGGTESQIRFELVFFFGFLPFLATYVPIRLRSQRWPIASTRLSHREALLASAKAAGSTGLVIWPIVLGSVALGSLLLGLVAGRLFLGGVFLAITLLGVVRYLQMLILLRAS